MKYIKILFCTILLICLTITPSYALNLVYADYDNDNWQTIEISFAAVDTVPSEWYPLKAVSKHLPIDVSWDAKNRQVVVYSHDLNSDKSEFRYSANKLPSGMMAKDGVTYCSPKLLASYLSKTGFMHNGEVYHLAGECVESQLIDERNDDKFKRITLTTLYSMKLMMPDEYEFIRTHLTGGIKLIYKNEIDKRLPKNTMAAVAFKAKDPVCQIVHDYVDNEFLVRAMSHEAYHVYQYRLNGSIDEYWPTKYGDDAHDKFIKLNEK